MVISVHPDVLQSDRLLINFSMLQSYTHVEGSPPEIQVHLITLIALRSIDLLKMNFRRMVVFGY